MHTTTQNILSHCHCIWRTATVSATTILHTCITDLVLLVPFQDGKKPQARQRPRGVLFTSSASVSEGQDGSDLANQLTRFELFLLQDGEKKITETPFPRKSALRLVMTVLFCWAVLHDSQSD